ncbi:ribosome-associated protein [Desulfoluna spongiiphila]|uniref:Ribosome-associated protein n=2 Tax=Desulfoluna spongiiphila TaxID=419481 RepID=A0A1G5DDT0_9BACT|nr:ribosome-associated protein [Desulfoluna spongiiphila]
MRVGFIYKINMGSVARTIMNKEITADIYKSRTQIKKESEELQKLGERLIKLSPAQLKHVDIPDELRKAIEDARHISARKAAHRNRQFIGALMRECDPEPVREALDRLEAGLSLSGTPGNKPSEETPWAEAILDDDSAIETFLEKWPSGDRQRLRMLRRNALKKRDSAPKGKEFKALAACIRETIAMP